MPETYFPKIEEAHPGALKSQWIPDDPSLWEIGHFPDFLKARETLLANEANRRMKELLHGDIQGWLAGPSTTIEQPVSIPGGIDSEAEEKELEGINDWIHQQGLPRGILSYDFSDSESGQQIALFDLAWPEGIQTELSQPVALLLNEGGEVLAIANQAGYRCFQKTDDLKRYVQSEILAFY